MIGPIGKKTTVIIIFILVLAGVMVIPIGSSDTVDAEFGQWKLGIRAIGTDGSTTPLSVVNTIGGQLLSVSREGVEIESLEFFISAKAVGEGFTQVEIDLSSVSFKPTITDSYSFDTEYGSKVTIGVGEGFTEIYTYTLDADDIDSCAMSDGTYALKFTSIGSATYRGLPNGETETINIIPGAVTQITIETSTPDDPPPDPPSECTWEYKYEYGSWSNMGCVGDGKRKQIRDRHVYKRYRCSDEQSVPEWADAWTDNQYRTISDSSCNTPDPCVPSVTYGDWTSWIYDRCEGATRYDYRTRQVTTKTCPGPTTTYSTEKEWRHYIDNRACSLFSIVKISSTFSVI